LVVRFLIELVVMEKDFIFHIREYIKNVIAKEMDRPCRDSDCGNLFPSL